VVIDRRTLVNVDWVLLATSLILSAIGVAMVASATQPRRQPTTVQAMGAAATRSTPPPVSPPTRRTPYWLRQSAWLGASLIVVMMMAAVDYRRIADRAPLLYLGIVVVLVAMLFVGPRIAGTRRWLAIGSFQIQPSELAKIVAVLVVARSFAESRKEWLDLRDLVGPGAATAALAALIAIEPDLGTAFCLIPMFFVVSFLAGLRARALVVLSLLLLLGAGGLGWTFAKGYQRQRVVSYVARHVDADGWLGRQVARVMPLDARAMDQRGAGYQSRQSRIAVGSGGLLGRGYRQGGQSQLGYLPARHTDFVFSVLAEETGFIGVSLVLGLYLLLLWRALETTLHARDRLGAFIAAGVTTILAFQVIYNISMVAGLVPVKGLPLPFMSYGGSSLLFSFMAVGLILNVRIRRFAN
jgi:rod shape determining protein RodA